LKFRDYGQIYYFDSGAFVVEEGENVIVKTDQGMGLATVALVADEPPQGLDPSELKPIYRLATDEDLEKVEENEALAKEAFAYCRERIKERGLDMKLVDVEVFFDRGKIIFYFTAPNRIDFRELVKDLVKNYRTRIELRQIGVRHETQMVGAVGNCGQVCCCRRFLRKFAPVTIKMAKEQNLFLNPSKISGMCGRLLCCLNYEQQNYENFHRNCPKIGKKYQTSMGSVKLIRANMFRNSLTVIAEGEEKELTLEEWEELNPARPDVNQQQQQERPGGKPSADRSGPKPGGNKPAKDKPAQDKPKQDRPKREPRSKRKGRPQSKKDQPQKQGSRQEAAKAQDKQAQDKPQEQPSRGKSDDAPVTYDPDALAKHMSDAGEVSDSGQDRQPGQEQGKDGPKKGGPKKGRRGKPRGRRKRKPKGKGGPKKGGNQGEGQGGSQGS
jgi:cell fate regulator YaaT (PSP1 superfamily)